MGGRPCGWVSRCAAGELRAGRRSPAQVPARPAGPLDPGSLRQALRSELLVCRAERGAVRAGSRCPHPGPALSLLSRFTHRQGRPSQFGDESTSVVLGNSVDLVWASGLGPRVSRVEGGGCPRSATHDPSSGRMTTANGGDFAVRVPLTCGSSASSLPAEAVLVRAALCGVEEGLRACGLSDTLTLSETS